MHGVAEYWRKRNKIQQVRDVIMKADYSYWRAAMAGEKPKMFVDDPQPGFYRKSIRERNAKGNSKTVGYEPVAVYVASGELTAAIGQSLLTDRDKINELWSWIADNPISEETYRAVAERGEPWPDFQPVKIAAAPADETLDRKIAREILAASADLPNFAKIESDEQSSKARSLQQRFLDARGDAKKAYEAANRPLLDQQDALRKLWFPLRDEADAGSNQLRDAMGAWEDVKRQAARRAEEEQRKREEQHRKDAEWAKAGDEPAPEPPKPVASNAPPPSTQIKAAGARTATVKVKKFVTDIDLDKAFAQFRAAPEVKEALMALAQRAIDAGLPVDGATVEERSIVK